MKISTLIEKLQEIQKEHGDLLIVVQDGQDPSDPMEANYVEIKEWWYAPSSIVCEIAS